jgi:hypothetical protein
MSDTKISALTAGTAAATDRFPVAISPFGSGDNRYLTPALLGTLYANTIWAGGTVTSSTPFGLTKTWNNAGVTFTAFKIDITDQNSAAASLLMDLQVGSATKLNVTKAGRIISADGGFFNSSLSGVFASGANLFLYGNNGSPLTIGTSSVTLTNGAPLIFVNGTRLTDDAANTLALRNDTNAQSFNWYGNYVSSTDYHRGALKVAKTTLSGVTGASVTATSLIPDGAFVIGVTTKVTTALGAGGGTTGYQVGDGSDADRWGEATTITLGTSTDNTNATANPTGAFTAAQNVVITAVGGNFDGTGVIMVNAFYLIAQAD